MLPFGIVDVHDEMMLVAMNHRALLISASIWRKWSFYSLIKYS